MKKTFLYFCLLFIVQTAFAADSLYVREQQIPILIDRIDNVLYEMRIPAQKGDVLNEITIQIGDNVDLSDIQAIRLFYSGVEAPSRKGEHFSPVTYISSHIPGNTRKALESYSVRQDEVSAPLSRTVKLTSKQPMLKGINYFWAVSYTHSEPTRQAEISYAVFCLKKKKKKKNKKKKKKIKKKKNRTIKQKKQYK